MNIKYMVPLILIFSVTACNRNKPKPISNDITKTTVAVNGKKDSVINNPEKNYGNATVSEPCVKSLLIIIQNTDSYKKMTSAIAPQNIIYDVNWITSSKPMDIGNGDKIVNGMAVAVISKSGGSHKKLITYLYNNEDAQFYLQNMNSNYDKDVKLDSASLKKIRNSCFWGVASAK